MLKTPLHKVKIFYLTKLQSWGFHTKGPCYITVHFQRYWQKYFFVVICHYYSICLPFFARCLRGTVRQRPQLLPPYRWLEIRHTVRKKNQKHIKSLSTCPSFSACLNFLGLWMVCLNPVRNRRYSACLVACKVVLRGTTCNDTLSMLREKWDVTRYDF